MTPQSKREERRIPKSSVSKRGRLSGQAYRFDKARMGWYNAQRMKAVIYQLFVRHFSNTKVHGATWGSKEENGCGSFAGVNDAALRELADMGITHLWLTGTLRHATRTEYPDLPAHPASVVKGIAGSPYAVVDYFDVDPDLAENPAERLTEFRELLARVRKWGMTPMIDFVPNHVSCCYASTVAPQWEFGRLDRTDVFFDRDNSFFYLDRGTGDGRMELPDGEFLPERGRGRVTGNNAATWNPSNTDWYETVKLNYGCDYRHGAAAAEALPGLTARPEELPRTWLLMDEALAWWQSMGVGGFRCDMAHMIPLPFWRRTIARARLRGDVFFMAEAYNDGMKLMNGDALSELLAVGFDAVYDAEAYHALRGVYESGGWANDLDRFHRPENPLFFRGVRYVENHDEPRMASPLFWGGVGEKTARAAMAAQFLTTCGPVLFYNGQEVAERADGPGGFSGADGRTSIFDYTSLPRLQRWYNQGRCDGAALPGELRDLRDFCSRLLRLLQFPAVAQGGFYGLNWANQQTPQFGREPGESSSGHRMYAFLRHDPASRTALLVVCNFSADADAEACVHFSEDACAWARRTAASFRFTDLLDPSAPPALASRDTLLSSGLTLRVPAGSVRVLSWDAA